MLIGKHEQNIDVEGRIAIPEAFRNSLGDKVVIVGLSTHIEIWDKNEWEKL